MFVNCHSYHSLRYGTIPVEELVALGAAHGATAMALTDINTVTGVYDFIKACREQGIHAVVGMEFREAGRLCYIGLARNREGFAELCRLRTAHNLNNTPLPEVPPATEQVYYIYPLEKHPQPLRDNDFIGVRIEQCSQLLLPKWKGLLHKMVVWHPVTFRGKKEYNLHRILRAIELNTLLSKLNPGDYCATSEQMLPETELRARFAEFPDIIRNTEALLAACRFEFEFKTLKNKKHYTKSRESDRQLLTKLALDGFKWRYPPNHQQAYQRVMKELAVIDELGFSGYFLITWDIIRYSNSRGFMHVGRGSGANSIVSYCLGITDICPIELNLYFERFLNPARTSPPDFDIDWSWQDRDEILSYIFKRFDTGHVAFCGTIAEFKYRSIFRELGKAFGLPKEELDALTHSPPSQHDSNRVVRLIHEYGTLLEKYPNQRSMHACGILISEEPITQYTALELPPKGFPVAQFDMHIAEEIGFEKFDILSQRGIGHINDCVQLIARNRGEQVNIRDVRLSKNHPTCNTFLKSGKTLGCFYIESPAMRGLLRKLQCDNYITLVAASSIIRPGVAKSGMMSEFVFRHNFPDQFEFFHPVFEEQLAETYGVMVYQEDVIKIAHHFAGLDLADADILRRAMSGKTRSKKEFEGVRQRFFDNCRALGHPDELSKEVYRQIESFAGYSFCKAHSASYAVESYQSLYLKVHYPIEFMVAVINNFGGFYRTEVYVHEAKMAGAVVRNPCVNHSEYLTTLYGKEVFLGFIHLKSLEERVSKEIAAERTRGGPYRSLEDFVRRVELGVEALQILIQIGAFRFTGKPKSELMLQGRMLLANFKPEDRHALLFEEPTAEYALPVLSRSPFEDAFDEIELLGFPVSCSPFDLLKTKFRGDAMQAQLLDHTSKVVRMIGYLVSIKHVPTKRGMMNFGTWFDVEGNHFDTAHFSDSLAEYPFQGSGCYLIQGIVQCDYNFATVVVQKMAKLPFIPDPRYEDEKDFRFKVYSQMKEDISITHRAPYPSTKEIGLPRNRMM
jgi:DNA polymerase-3 subunit alpha/error-prone DNA polymerase